MHKAHMQAEDNPYAIRRRATQTRFSVNVWAGFIRDQLIKPYLLLFLLTWRKYLLFLQQVLPQLWGDEQISALTTQTIWFQHDGAQRHYSQNVCNYLDVSFDQQQIECGGPVLCPIRSSDLSYLDFYLWGHMKLLVCDPPVDNAGELVARTEVVA